MLLPYLFLCCLLPALMQIVQTFALDFDFSSMKHGPNLFNSTTPSSKKYVFDASVQARLQWLTNEGYCGEVSTVASGLKYGQYFSQYDVRAIAAISPVTPQQDNFYLVGTNDLRASKLLKLNAVEFPHPDLSQGHTDKYLAWVKSMIRRGYAPTITVLMNQFLFYGDTDPNAGYPDYDHIVSATSVQSDFDDDNYHDDDIITFSDHGLYGPWSLDERPYYFTYTFKNFKATRQEANTKTDPGKVYSLVEDPSQSNFGITHTGPIDDDGVLLPVRVDTDVNYEKPQIKPHSEERPAPMGIKLTVTVSGLQPGKSYTLYRYDDEDEVPTKGFNSNAKAALSSTSITAQSGNYVMGTSIMSNEKVIFRAVSVDAP